MLTLKLDYLFFLRNRFIQFFLIVVMMIPLIVTHTHYYDYSQPIMDTESEIIAYTQYVQQWLQGDIEELYPNRLTETEIQDIYRQYPNDAFSMLNRDAAAQLNRAFQNGNQSELIELHEYLYQIRYVGLVNNYIERMPINLTYSVIDYDKYYLETIRKVKEFYHYLTEHRLNEAQFMVSFYEQSKVLDILSPLGILVVSVSIILFLTWKRFEKDRKFLYSTTPVTPFKQNVQLLIGNVTVVSSIAIIAHGLSLIYLMIRSKADGLLILKESFFIGFNQESFYHVELKLILLIILAATFVTLLLMILSRVLRSNYLSAIIIYLIYIYPFILPFINGEKISFYPWNPFTYLDVETFLSGVRQVYWNDIEAIQSWNQGLGIFYFGLTIIGLWGMNVVLIKIGKREPNVCF